MALLSKSKRLKKQLSLLNVYAIVTGATLADGFFLLPGLAAEQVGPAVIFCYLAATVPLFPAMLSIIELSTAMPRAGGVYYFIDRSMHPLLGTIGGLGTWFAIILKIAFSLIGMGAYLKFFFPNVDIVALAGIMAIALGIVNLFGAHKTGLLQIILVFSLLLFIGWFVGVGSFHVEQSHFRGIFDYDAKSFLSTTGLVYVSYIGITKIASVSEEIKNPERNLPLGIFLAMGTVVAVYALGTFVILGIVPPEKLYGNLTSVAEAANILSGSWGVKLSALAALAAFLSVANAGILSGSRYPLAMSRDHIMPRFFSSLSQKGIPLQGICVTTLLVLLSLVLFDPLKIAKLASAFQLLMFSLICFAVIVMRESKIESYDPGYRSPCYPWMQIFGIFSPFLLIIPMGIIPIFFSCSLIAFGTGWYYWYARKRVHRVGAIYHIFERLGVRRFEGLDKELRSILIEKGLRSSDPFDEVMARAAVIFIPEKTTFEDAVLRASKLLAHHLPETEDQLAQRFLEGTRLGITPVTQGIALPHLRSVGIKRPELVLLQCRPGINIESDQNILCVDPENSLIHAIFFLISPQEDPGQHLRILASIAGYAEDEKFISNWLSATNEVQLKELFFKGKNFLYIHISANSKNASLIGMAIRDLELPDNCLVAFIHRSNKTIIPRGGTILNELDSVTFIGKPEVINQLYVKYG